MCTLNNLVKENKSNITHTPCGAEAKGLYKSNKCELKRKIVAKIFVVFFPPSFFGILFLLFPSCCMTQAQTQLEINTLAFFFSFGWDEMKICLLGPGLAWHCLLQSCGLAS